LFAAVARHFQLDRGRRGSERCSQLHS